jgi:hypothetical protein
MSSPAKVIPRSSWLCGIGLDSERTDLAFRTEGAWGLSGSHLHRPRRPRRERGQHERAQTGNGETAGDYFLPSDDRKDA